MKILRWCNKITYRWLKEEGLPCCYSKYCYFDYLSAYSLSLKLHTSYHYRTSQSCSFPYRNHTQLYLLLCIASYLFIHLFYYLFASGSAFPHFHYCHFYYPISFNFEPKAFESEYDCCEKLFHSCYSSYSNYFLSLNIFTVESFIFLVFSHHFRLLLQTINWLEDSIYFLFYL